MNENSHSFHEKERRDEQVSKHIRLGKKVLVWDVLLIIIREHISRGCGPLEMCRKNSLYSSLVLLEEVPSHFWVNCLS